MQGGDQRDAHGLPRAALERARLLHGGRAAPRHRGPAPGGVDPHDARRAQPHRVASPVPSDERLGPRRGLDDGLRLARAGADAAIPRDGDRPANEPQLHPARRRRGRPPRRLARRPRRALHDRRATASASTLDLLAREPHLPRASRRGRASSPPRRRSPAASPGRSCGRPGSRGTCARPSRTSPTTRSTSTSCTASERRLLRPVQRSVSTRSCESVKIVRQCAERIPAGDYRVQDRKVTPPPRARIDESMEALIHHFKLFTEGFRVPAGRDLRRRSSRLAARSAATSSPTGPASRSGSTSAGRPSTTCSASTRW